MTAKIDIVYEVTRHGLTRTFAGEKAARDYIWRGAWDVKHPSTLVRVTTTTVRETIE